jgi:hypothetical protein
MKRLIKIVTVLLLFQYIIACSQVKVRAWEKGVLAREDMAVDADAQDLGIDDHIYFSKESSSGGRSFAGGGCGCN